MVELSIIVLGYNQKEKVLRLLSCIEKQVQPPTFEVIYTDDGSTDGTIEALLNSTFTFPFRIADKYAKHTNRSKARNRGAKIAQGDWLLFLDGDGELNEVFVYELWKNKQIRQVVQSAIAVHPEAHCPARIYEVHRSSAYRFGSQAVDPRLLQSGCFLIEKSLFCNIGGFPEEFGGRSGEDVAFGIILGQHQIVVRSVPTAIFYHNHPRSIEQLYQVKFAYASQGLPRIIRISTDIFSKARLHTVFQLKEQFPSTLFQKLLRFFLRMVPVQFLVWIGEHGNPKWTVKTVIPFLCYHATVFGFEKYVRTGLIDSQEV
ncbi:MAG: glycosyltransferase family 2 protein [bacterium]|nr:glycosyltransferase family 2 protein [bacterium]